MKIMSGDLPTRYDADTTLSGAGDGSLSVRVDRGPHAYHGVPGMGFVGTHCIRFRGQVDRPTQTLHRVSLHDVDIAITAETVLSYVIGYALDDDHRYAGGYVAVDLLLDDGRRLSELGAVDQLGYDLHATAQGESKALYPHQWNLRRCEVGALAGRRSVAVELCWDAGPGLPVDGWVDGIRLGPAPRDVRSRPADWVVTTRGTQSNGTFSRGNNLPATAWPNGFAFFSPCTDARTLRWVYSWSDHNDDHNRPRLQALSVSHQPSPWMGDRLTFQVMPQLTSRAPTAEPTARSLVFDHDHELARPHHYRVELSERTGADRTIVAEMAPTDHAVAIKFSFPDATGRLVLDNATVDGRCTVTDDGIVTGWSESLPGPRADGAGRMFVYGYADAPVVATGRLDDGAGPDTGAYLEVGDAASDSPLQVTFWLGTSFLSVDQARRNLELEIGGRGSEASFETLVDLAGTAWDERLSAITVDDALATDEVRTTVCSHLYRLNLYPNSGHENAGTADEPRWVHSSPGQDAVAEHTDTHTGCVVEPGKIYVNNGFWDTYRTAWPLYALLYPRLAAELVDGFVQHYRESGWIPRWSSPGFADCMVGTSSDVAFADAMVKGVEVDLDATYLAALRNASVATDDTRMGRKSLDRAIFLGYTPVEEPEGMSWSIDGYINDFGIASMARWLLDHDHLPPGYDRGRLTDELAWFTARSTDYVRLFRPRRGLFSGRTIDGSWRVPDDSFDADAWGADYTETNAWNMAVSVPHDGAGLAGLHGGRDRLAERLTELFDRPERGDRTGAYGHVIHEMTEARDVRMGMFGHSNQPAHHLPFMWLHAQRPDRCQAAVREIMRRFHQGSEIGQGYGGDEDNGEMSAWHLFAALGIYPAAVGSPVYSIGSPLYGRVTLRRDTGQELVVTADGSSDDAVYVAGVELDGERLERTWVGHDELIGAGTLRFDMSTDPQPWGSGPDAAPPSVSPTVDPPRVLRDVATGSRISGPDDVELGPLVDDRSATSVQLVGGAQILLELDEDAELELYTVTSAAEGAVPGGWTLEGLVDQSWTVLDQRTDERFSWARQTRPFSLATGPATVRHLRWTPFSDGAVAQLELLARNPGQRR